MPEPLIDAMPRLCPQGQTADAAIVHNDLKLDNCQFDPADPEVIARIEKMKKMESNKIAPPMFAPLKLREMEVANRITAGPAAHGLAALFLARLVKRVAPSLGE